jgi:uncharacterized protein YbjQ (UPF0145 family)
MMMLFLANCIHNKTEKHIITTTKETIPDKEITEILGVARGSTLRARNTGRDIFAGPKNNRGPK